jgi:rod shape determining protein RodA
MGAMRVERGYADTFTARAPTAAWQSFDVQLAFYALALAVIGLMIAYANSEGSPLTPGSTFTRGLMWLALAIVVFVAAAAFDYRWLRTFALPIYVINLGLLILTLAVGTGVGGVSRWVTIPVLGLQFQFSEVAKILMIGVLASYIAVRRDRLGKLATVVGAGMLMGPPFALVMAQPDLGTALVFLAVLFGTLFLSGASLKWLTLPIVGAVAAMPIIWTILHDYQRRRLLTFLDPTADPLNAGFQTIQSMLAVSSGGMFGRGLTSGSPGGMDLLPVQSTDFAAAVLFQELGFIGGVVMFLLFCALIWRVLLVGWRSTDIFGTAFAAGVASLLLFQLVVNVGMILGIGPVTGIPLPFVTHGGASLLSIALGLGILQAINMRRSLPTW